MQLRFASRIETLLNITALECDGSGGQIAAMVARTAIIRPSEVPLQRLLCAAPSCAEIRSTPRSRRLSRGYRARRSSPTSGVRTVCRADFVLSLCVFCRARPLSLSVDSRTSYPSGMRSRNSSRAAAYWRISDDVLLSWCRDLDVKRAAHAAMTAPYGLGLVASIRMEAPPNLGRHSGGQSCRFRQVGWRHVVSGRAGLEYSSPHDSLSCGEAEARLSRMSDSAQKGHLIYGSNRVSGWYLSWRGSTVGPQHRGTH